MYSSYCHHCDKNWNNATPNCPHCGSPDASARFDGAKKEEDIPMNEEEESFRNVVADAMKDGAALAVASEANTLITSGIQMAAISAGVPPKMLESALFQKGTPVLGSLLLLYAAQEYPDLIPKSEFVAKAAKLALTEATKGSIEPAIRQAMPMLLALGASGEKMAKLEAAKKDAEEAKSNDDFQSRINDDDVEDASFEIREVM